jgi:tRNA threonylcarbamoyladenosine biosynthesis protein TsaB
MKRILAIDTSHAVCTVALTAENMLFSRSSAAPRQHASELLPMIQSLLEEQQIHMRELDAIALVIGPGSFTGLRIGAGVAQGLSFATGVPVFCVSSLAVMAMKAHLAHSVTVLHVCLQARDNEVYAAVYAIQDGCPVLQGMEQVCTPESLHFEVPGLAVGDGWALYPALPEAQQALLECHSDASALASMAVALAGRGEQGVTASAVLPVYLKDQMDYQA